MLNSENHSKLKNKACQNIEESAAQNAPETLQKIDNKDTRTDLTFSRNLQEVSQISVEPLPINLISPNSAETEN